MRRIKTHHENSGDEVTAELPGYRKPPTFRGPRRRGYIPDVYVFNRGIIYEVKEYSAGRWAAPKLKAFLASPDGDEVILVLCTGTPAGVPRVERHLSKEGVDCEVLNYQELQFW
ncbi:MAG: hypothetical protein ACE5K9_12420 [Candidatus Methylomirabilales bacterium]